MDRSVVMSRAENRGAAAPSARSCASDLAAAAANGGLARGTASTALGGLAGRQHDRARVSAGLPELIRRAYVSRRTRARIIVDHCLKRLPHYRGLPKSRLAEVRASVLHHVTLFYQVTLQAGRPLTSAELEHSRQLARQRAAQGTPLGDYLTFFQVGLTLLWEHLMKLIGNDAVLRAQLLDRVELILSNQAQLMTALTEAYLEERERLSRFREQNLDEFFQLLLADNAAENLLEARARGLGVAFNEPRAVAIFGPAVSTGTDGAGITADDVRRLLASSMLEAATWVGRCREGFVALIPADLDSVSLGAIAAGLPGDDVRVGVGSAARDLVGARRSAREALRALRIGATLGRAQAVHRYADVAVLDLVGIGSPDAEGFVRRVLDPVMSSGSHETYLDTLRELSRSGYRVKLAAAALSVHPHTLTYRLKQLRARFGIDLTDPEARLRVQLALLLLDAMGPSSGPRRPRRGTPARTV